jgi:fibronectin type 3 domain-containing protein
MTKTLRILVKTIPLLLVLLAPGAGGLTAGAAPPPVPTNFEARPASQTAAPITLKWDASPGATSYNIYRGTSPGAEGSTPYATATTNTFIDTNVAHGPPPIYFYTVAAVGPGGVSGKSVESATPTPLPVSTGSGNVAGVTVGNRTVYYGKDALLNGFDWFQALNGWFPQVLGSTGSITPGHVVVDMAYANEGIMAFNNVVVPTSGLYTVDYSYAFAPGLFPNVFNRQMGLMVNGVVITSTMRFTRTGSFEVYRDSSLQVNLQAGQNSVVLFAVTDHGVSRVDTLTVTPAAASSPAGPTNLTATPGNGAVLLSWTGSAGATSYNIYRGPVSDGEAVAALGSTIGSTTMFTDTGLSNGATYFYNIAAVNSVGTSPDSNEVSVKPINSGPPSIPNGVSTVPGNGAVTVSWNASSGATSYSLFRSTTSGAEGTTPIVSGIVATSFTNSGLTNGTAYFYRLAAVNGVGTSVQSVEVSATPSAGASSAISIACGNNAVGTFVADKDFTGGAVSNGTTAAIDTSQVVNPAPMAVYQHGRKGNSTYTVPGFGPGTSHTVRLHFAEYFHTGPAQRSFNVLINGTQVLTNFDIFAAAGAALRANAQTFTAIANGSGQVVITFTTGATDVPLVSGIEVN